MNWLQRAAIAVINVYQQRGGGREQFRVVCNFEPSCSDYARQAITHYGIVRGAGLAAARICRCRDRDQVGTIDDPLVREE